MSNAKTIVFVTPSWRGSGDHCYHTDKDCYKLQGASKILERSKDHIKPDRRICSVCGENEGDKSKHPDKTCPYCRETVGKLPMHLPQCPEK